MRLAFFASFASFLLPPLLALSLAGCAQNPRAAATPTPQPATPQIVDRLPVLEGAQAILLGEQHDADEHHRLERDLVAALSARDRLSALVIEMAERGTNTDGLARESSEDEVRTALAWDEKAWPWADYGPMLMTAVRAGVPVLGANLARPALREAMEDASLDTRLPGPALKAQQQAIRIGHCGQLPESRITPMTRAQIARDRAMADVVAQQVGVAKPGRQVLLVSGAGHADRGLGVARHLPREMKLIAVRMQAGGDAADRVAGFDAVWITPALPDRGDPCAELAQPMPGAAK